MYDTKNIRVCFTYASFSYFQIVGIGLLLIGVWIEVESKDYEALNNDLFIPSIMMMSVGFIIIINSIVGLSGVLKENAALLKLVSILQASMYKRVQFCEYSEEPAQ